MRKERKLARKAQNEVEQMAEILNQTKAGYDKAQFKDNVNEERR